MHFARILQAPLQPDTTKPAAEFFRDTIGPSLKRQPGYVTSRFLTNAITNKCLLVMLWDSEAHREEAESSGSLHEALQQIDHFSPSRLRSNTTKWPIRPSDQLPTFHLYGP